uniref:Gla domain-containing protein n=1 Tax=Salmo trutta TaxID=8032 RepID=A0A674A9H8_SALTR
MVLVGFSLVTSIPLSQLYTSSNCCSLTISLSGPPAPVFLSGQATDSVLKRQRRHNTGVFQDMLLRNLESVCLEESCDLEEAREAFENDEKTVSVCVDMCVCMIFIYDILKILYGFFRLSFGSVMMASLCLMINCRVGTNRDRTLRPVMTSWAPTLVPVYQSPKHTAHLLDLSLYKEHRP